MQRTASIRGACALVTLAALIATPSAAAFAIGVDAQSAGELNAAGGHATYGQTWVGTWMKTQGWSSYQSAMAGMATSGVTPVVLWYYWGDAISQSCVLYGCNGMTKTEWDSMAATLAQKANAAMGGKPFYVVLEPEFNKAGIAGWETFDGDLVNQASIIRANAPGAKIVLGFGSWGGYDAFDRAASASDAVGFQFMRASTRNAPSEAQAPTNTFVQTANDLHARFGKPVLVFDVAIGSYGGWEWVQQAALNDLKAHQADLANANVFGIVWRYVHDNTYSSGYFGAAESSWGLKSTSGAAKPGWTSLVGLSQGATTTPPATATPTTGFTNVHGNNWWIEAALNGAPTGVYARVNGGSWIAMPRDTWGTYAVSTSAPTGSTVELRADYAGAPSLAAAYAWPAATPISGASAFGATFSNVHGNAWWIQADVASTQTLATVAARIDGGAWTPLAKQSWGSWAASLHAPAGSTVQLQATSTSGATATSGSYIWSG
jgi:hypothetical protein